MKKKLKVVWDDRVAEGNQLLEKALEEALTPFGYRQQANPPTSSTEDRERELVFEMDDEPKQGSPKR